MRDDHMAAVWYRLVGWWRAKPEACHQYATGLFGLQGRGACTGEMDSPAWRKASWSTPRARPSRAAMTEAPTLAHPPLRRMGRADDRPADRFLRTPAASYLVGRRHHRRKRRRVRGRAPASALVFQLFDSFSEASVPDAPSRLRWRLRFGQWSNRLRYVPQTLRLRPQIDDQIMHWLPAPAPDIIPTKSPRAPRTPGSGRAVRSATVVPAVSDRSAH